MRTQPAIEPGVYIIGSGRTCPELVRVDDHTYLGSVEFMSLNPDCPEPWGYYSDDLFGRQCGGRLTDAEAALAKTDYREALRVTIQRIKQKAGGQG
jgi:hypothetical protein